MHRTRRTSAPAYGDRVEYAVTRKVRERNTSVYRVSHWPVWAWVYFLVPGPLIANLFHRGPDAGSALAGVRHRGHGDRVVSRQAAGHRDEALRDVLHRGEAEPGLPARLLHVAWSVIVAYAAVNLAGMIVAILPGRWMMHQLYATMFVPVMAGVWVLGALGWLPRAKPSVKYEGYERRIFYGAVWTVAIAQPVLWLLWRAIPRSAVADVAKLVVFAAILAGVGYVAWRGYLPRTRPIVPGEPITLDSAPAPTAFTGSAAGTGGSFLTYIVCDGNARPVPAYFTIPMMRISSSSCTPRNAR